MSDAGKNFKIEVQGIIRKLRKLPGAVDIEVRRAFVERGIGFTFEMKKNAFTGYSGNRNSDRLLQNRSGLLRRSFDYVVTGGLKEGKPLTLLVFSQGVKYARLQEYGGVIRPKKAKNLTIPLDDALTSAGVQRYSSVRDLISYHPKQVFFKTVNGKTFVVSRGVPGRDYKREPKLLWLYILKKSVKIPPRLGFRDRWKSSPETMRLLRKAMRRAADRVEREKKQEGGT